MFGSPDDADGSTCGPSTKSAQPGGAVFTDGKPLHEHGNGSISAIPTR